MTSAGFPSNNVRSIACDSQGTVWVATDWGLCRYAAGAWTLYQEGGSGLPENGLRALAVDADDRVWIGTTLSGVVIHDGSSWSVFDTGNSPLPENEVNCITIDHRGWAWIGTTAGLACYTGTEWRIYNDSPTSYNGLVLNANNIQCVAVGEDDLVAIGTVNGGFHYLTDTLVMVYATYINSFPDNTAMGVVVDNDAGERWLACPAGGLLRQGGSYVGGPWFQYVPWNSGIPAASLTSLQQDDQGGLWMGSTLSGLITRTPSGTFQSWNTGNSDLPDDHVRCVAMAPDGSVWVGTFQGGAARFASASSIAEAVHDGPGLTLFPNPASDRLWCTWNNEASQPNGKWILFDMQGRCLLTGAVPMVGPWHLDVSPLAPGAYEVVLLSKDGRPLRTRFIKE